jgi:hypothetical protein
MMNMTKVKVIALAALACWSPYPAAAALLPLYDGFETYSHGTALDGNNGWGASDSAVKVQTNVVWSQLPGTNAVIMPASSVLSNVVSSVSRTNVWVDLYVTNSISMPVNAVGPEAVKTNLTVQWFFETNGFPVVWNRTNSSGNGVWLVCSNDYWGTNTAVFNTNGWMRITVCENYNNQTASFFLNQHLLRQLPFIDMSRSNSALFQVVGGTAVTSYIDEVSMRYAPTNFNADLDHDGVPDADEIQSRGDVSTIRRLGITLATTNLTDGGTGGGWLTDPATNVFDVMWTMSATNLHWSASNDFYAAGLLTNGVSVDAFDYKTSNTVSFVYPNSYADATVTVAFARMPMITASNSAYGSITPASTNAYLGESRTFTFDATNSHYFISGVLTNAELLATNAYTGWGTNSGSFVWSNIQANGGIEVQYSHLYTNSATVVTNGGPGPCGTVSASTNEVYPGGLVTFTLTPGKAYGVTALTNNGALVATFGGCLEATNYTFSNVQTNLNVQGVFTYTARRRVPGDYETLDEARAAAISGDTIVVSNGSTVVSGLTLSNMTLIATNTTVAGGLTVTTGTLSACTGLVVDATTVSGLLVVSNGSLNLGTLVFGVGATVQVVHATAFIANGVTYTGSVILDGAWDSVIVSQTPPFSDDFERYATNPATALSKQGYFGWGASTLGVVVQGSVFNRGARAVEMPVSAVLSNSLAPTSSSNVWVEWTFREPGRIDESAVTVVGRRTNMAVLVFVNTNNFVTVYNPESGAGGAFNVLSNDVWGNKVELSPSDWARFAVNLNYKTRRAAVLVDGRVMIQGLRFINTNQSNCARFEADAGVAGATYLDAVNVWTNADSITSGDNNYDGTPDAVEIDFRGSVLFPPRGSVFKIR